jgi:FlaA1/EpsC-like NDP-sugar epimerase
MQAKADLLPARAKVSVGLRPILMLRAVRAVLDVGAWALATLGAWLLHYDGAVATELWPMMLATLAVFGLLKLAATLVFKVNRQSWEKFGFRDAANIVVAIGAVVVVALLLLLTVGSGVGVPLAIPVIDGMLTVLFMLGARGFARYLNEVRVLHRAPGRRLRRIVLIGAGEAGSMLAREMLRHPETGMRPVGFIDDDPSKAGRTIATVPVLGGLDDLPFIVQNEQIDEVLITIPSADGQAIRGIVERVRSADPDLHYRTMPALHELLSGQVTVNRIRDVGIEDLLRRPTVELDTDSILSYLQGKRVMVTGAGGSIGSELVRQICRFGPAELILFGHGENSIYQLERELDVQWPGVRYQSVIAAVQNVQRLDYVFRHYQPQVVFHTAAHKHVPLMELNPEEAVFNNIIGTRNLVRLALRYGISHFVNVSTDKAVNPSSVMGASKRMAELIVEDAARDAGAGQVFVSVRFGNVLGSRGSAVPIFKQQIQAGGPVTVTHPDMMRYFMTIPEASRLVLQASALGTNGEIYILDMGEPVRVLDLVKDLIRLSGLEPDVDIPIVFTGSRPGEKLFEELMTEEERAGRTEHDKIFVAKPHPVSREALEATVAALQDAALRSDGEGIRRVLGDAIHGARLEPTTRDGDASTQVTSRKHPALVN